MSWSPNVLQYHINNLVQIIILKFTLTWQINLLPALGQRSTMIFAFVHIEDEDHFKKILFSFWIVCEMFRKKSFEFSKIFMWEKFLKTVIYKDDKKGSLMLKCTNSFVIWDIIVLHRVLSFSLDIKVRQIAKRSTYDLIHILYNRQ